VGDGLRVVFDPAIDAGGWPGVLGARAAAAGEVWLGPMGLLGRLETELGLGGVWATRAERACELAAQLAGRDGWWRESLEADPVGTCERLVRDRDALAMWGWRGEAVSERLAGLWEATRGAAAGTPDRIAAVAAALERRAPALEEVALVVEVAELAPLWQDVLARMAVRGVRVVELVAARAQAAGDLGRAARGWREEDGRQARPAGDGTLVLLRAHGPLAAAEEVAGHLAAMESLEGVVVVGADEVLDAALARCGVPRVGGERAMPASAALVPLAMEAAFAPMDPRHLHALLCLDPGPVPRRVARRLVSALARFPGRGSAEWRAAMAEGLAACEEERRAGIAARLEGLLVPAARRDGAIAVVEIARRLAIVASWARSRAEGRGEVSLWSAALVADELRQLVELAGRPALTHVELTRLSSEAMDACAVAMGEAGLSAVREPGAVLGPARTIIWWGFTRDRAAAPRRLRLSRAERAALVAAGVRVAEPGAEMEAEAARWRRPLESAEQRLVLVCPRTDEAGEPSSPHPLWDELASAMEDPALAVRLEVSQLEAARAPAQARPLPAPAPAARAAGPIALRERESPSSLETLLGCSLAWTLDYRGGLRAGLSDGPGVPGNLAFGQLAHHFLALVFAEGPAGAAERAAALIDRDLEGLCEALCLPRFQIERETVRQAVVASAAELAALVERTGATVAGVELEVTGTLGGVAVGGWADLVLADPDVVLDLKWGKSSNRRLLERGTAIQLATYAELLRRGGARPQVGYFILRTQELFAEAGSTLRDVAIPGRASADDTLAGMVAALAARVAELARGELHAPGAAGEEIEGELAGGHLTITPKCRYCEMAALCGRGGCA
jgi:ATP-dependent helicase/nuclease subunit B